MKRKYKIIFGTYIFCIVCFLLYINMVLLGGIPHVPDSVAYLFMTKLFAEGKVIDTIPVSPQHFNFFPGILSIQGGKWLFQYSFGQPLILLPGYLLGFPNIIPPIIGGLFVFVLFLIGKELYDLKTAIFISILPVFSPFFLENASEFMSHNTSAFFLILAFYLLILFLKRGGEGKLFLSAACIGMLINTRPLTALPFIFLFLILLIFLSKNERLRSLVVFGIGLSYFIELWLIFNLLTTGNMFVSQYYNGGSQFFKIQNYTLLSFITERFNNVTVLFRSYIPMLFNLPIEVVLIPLAVVLFSKKTLVWNYIFALSIILIPFAYFFYDGTFIMYGPRFWYETLPFVFILAGKGISMLYSYNRMFTLFFLICFALTSFFRLVGLSPTTDPDIFSPVSLSHLKTFNFTDTRIILAVQKSNLKNSIVFVKDTCAGQWWCYGSVFSQNSPRLDTDIIYAKDLGKVENLKLMTHYPKRQHYMIDYNMPHLNEYQ